MSWLSRLGRGTSRDIRRGDVGVDDKTPEPAKADVVELVRERRMPPNVSSPVPSSEVPFAHQRAVTRVEKRDSPFNELDFRLFCDV